MRDRLKDIESQILRALREADSIQPHDAQWRNFVRRLQDAKVAIWHAMDEIPEAC